ncbi:MAG TPA: T9SS type A sorting domain-containing protein [Flavobacterium sp.]|jgi:hypothetical protein
MKKIYALLFLGFSAFTASAQVVISHIYGGGGNSGATYTHDFVELFNRGTSAATLTGHTLQYASASGAFNTMNRVVIPTITIEPGAYYLIQLAQQAGGTSGVALPTPDFIPSPTTLNLSATNGKIALASDNVIVTSPTGSNVVDFVGFGTANASEGGTAAPAPSAATSILRANNGCTDTNNNGADFATGTITPRNSATAPNSCIPASVSENQIAGLRVYPNPVVNGTFNVDTDANATKSVSIFDVLGKEVAKTTISGNTVNVNHLVNGVYIVKVTEEGKTATKKLIIK